MILYHWTCEEHLPDILEYGLRTTESNLSQTTPRTPPDVVWFTTDSEGVFNHGLTAPEEVRRRFPGATFPDKTEYVLTVDVPDDWAHPWQGWALEHGIEGSWMLTIVSTAGGWGAVKTWCVVERPVPKEMIVSVGRRGGWPADEDCE